MAVETKRHKNITSLPPQVQGLGIVIVLAIASLLLRPSVADVGTAAHYSPPYLRKQIHRSGARWCHEYIE